MPAVAAVSATAVSMAAMRPPMADWTLSAFVLRSVTATPSWPSAAASICLPNQAPTWSDYAQHYDKANHKWDRSQRRPQAQTLLDHAARPFAIAVEQKGEQIKPHA